MDDPVELMKKFYIDESLDTALYSYLSKLEGDPSLKENFKKLSEMEAKHAKFWRDLIEKSGGKAPTVKPSRLRLALIKIIKKLLGTGMVASLLEMGENNAIKKNFDFYKNYKLTDEERTELSRIIVDEIEHERLFYETKKRFNVGNVRDFVLGMNDGLVEILGAVTGLSAVYVYAPRIVGVSGLIVGIAGALSMGIGAFISVRSQRQINESIKERLEILFTVSPERARKEFIDRLIESGLPEEAANQISKELKEDAIVDFLIEEVSENEVRAAFYTGIAYLMGVAFPVLPYFLAKSSIIALPFSVLLAATALGVVGSVISLISGISVRRKVTEMVATGIGAAFLSYLFGRLMEAIFHISAL